MLRQPGSSVQKLALIYASNERRKSEEKKCCFSVRVGSVHLCVHEQICVQAKG